MREIDLAIIGGGPAGLAAAAEASKNGVKNIVILEREHALGGILQQCVHTGFGLHLFGEELTGPEFAERLVESVRELGIETRTDTMVFDITKDNVITAVNSMDGLIKLKARAIILAMGCRERTRGALNIPGTRPAGVYTAGTAQRFVNIEGYMPGRKIVILGSGDIGLIMARRLTLEGAEVKMVCELMPCSGGLKRNIVQCLEDFNIPLKLSHTVVEIHGKERLEGVTVAKVDERGIPVAETCEFVECDTLLLSVGLIPENELTKAAGIDMDTVTSGPVVDDAAETSHEGVFACGNVVRVYDLVDNVTLEGYKVGKSAADYILNRSSRKAPGVLSERPGVLAERPVIPAERPGSGIRRIIPHGNNKECGEGGGSHTSAANELTCTVCPLGCRINIIVGEDGSISDMKGNRCKRGASYARMEYLNPVRTITSTIRIEKGHQPLVPVKTDRPVPKAAIFACMEVINKTTINPPVMIGDILIKNILNTGANIVATGNALQHD